MDVFVMLEKSAQSPLTELLSGLFLINEPTRAGLLIPVRLTE